MITLLFFCLFLFLTANSSTGNGKHSRGYINRQDTGSVLELFNLMPNAAGAENKTKPNARLIPCKRALGHLNRGSFLNWTEWKG